MNDEVLRDLLERATDAGATSVRCVCGRTHFNDEDEDYEELRMKHPTGEFPPNPQEIFLEHDYTIRWFYWDGSQVVIGCDCKIDLRVARIMLDSADFVRKLQEALSTDRARQASEKIRALSDRTQAELARAETEVTGQQS